MYSPSLLLLSTIVSSYASAEAGLSLSEALSDGLQHSPSVQAADAAFEKASWHRTGSLSTFIPSLELNAQHIFSYKLQYQDIEFGGTPTTFPLIFPRTLLALSSRITLFEGLSGYNRYLASEKNEDSASHALDWEKFRTERTISLAFYEALAAQMLADVARQNQKTLEDHLNQIHSLEKAGAATHYDRLRVEVQVSEAVSEVLRADDNVQIARMKLSNAIGSEFDSRPLTGSLPKPEKDRLAEASSNNIESQGELQSKREHVQSLEKLEAAQSTYWSPRLALGGSILEYNNRTDSPTDWDQYRSAYQVGLYLTWNLFDGLQSIASSKEATYERIRAEKELERERLKTKTDFEFWKRRYAYSTALYETKISDISKSEESVRLAKLNYRAGTRTSTEVLDSELELFRVRAESVRAQLDCAEALLQAEIALGKRI